MSSHHIQIGDISPRIQYTGDGAQVAFTYPFPIFKDADIEVFEDTTVKTLTTDYSVSGAGNSSGGTVTFVTAPLTGVVVTLKRNITIARTSDFDESGAFRSKVINDELDTITAVQKQIQDSIERSLRLRDTDTAGTLTLPEKDTRKGNFLFFNATTGDPEAAELTGTTVLSDDNAQDIGTAAPGTSAEVSRTDHVHGLGFSVTAAAKTLLDDSTIAAIRATLVLDTGDTPTFAGLTLSDVMVNPGQHAFLAELSAGVTNVTGDGTTYTVACNTEIKDIGGFYNNSTFIFTADKAGLYFFYASANITGITGAVASVILAIVTSNRNYNNQFIAPGNSIAPSFGILADMDAADTAKFTIVGNGEASDVHDIAGPPWTRFGGFLLG